MPAESVPFQPGMLGPQRHQSRSREPAPLISRVGIRLLYPCQSAPAADLVVHGEHLMAAEICGALAPPDPLR